MNRNLATVFLLLVASVPAFATGSWRVECSTVPSRLMHRPVPYCALLPPSYGQPGTGQPGTAGLHYPVLYWLHGLGMDERSFVAVGGWALIERLRDEHKIGDFILVIPAGDSSFFVNSRDGARPYESFFLRELIPAIERRYRAQRGREARGISGVSMGGYGALRLALAHPELFGAVSAHSAALIQTLPRRGGLPSRLGGPQLRAMNDAFGLETDDLYWNRNNPLTLARTANLHGLEIYFDCGEQDGYGFDAGARALHQELSARHIPHDFHLYPGGHDWTYFAAHLPESLEFHWRAFAPRSRARP